jgi:glyoxylase I family protein
VRLEHVALAMPDPAATAAWYVDHLGFTVVRSSEAPPYAHFLAPPGGGSLLEIFRDGATAPLEHHDVDPMQSHLAFAVEDIEAESARLVAAGATAGGPVTRTPAGDAYGIVRDPWGVPLQLITRVTPLPSPNG